MVVAGNGRLKRLPGMLGAFGKLMAAQRGHVLATVTSARPLDESTLSEVRSALHKMVAAGRSLQIDTRVRVRFYFSSARVVSFRLRVKFRIHTFSFRRWTQRFWEVSWWRSGIGTSTFQWPLAFARLRKQFAPPLLNILFTHAFFIV